MSDSCQSIKPIKVSELGSYSDLKPEDIFLVIESGSSLFSRKTTFADIKACLAIDTPEAPTNFSGNFSGNFQGVYVGNFSGGYYGIFTSDGGSNLTGAFSGDFNGNADLTGNFNGNFNGNVVSTNIKATGSFTGNHYGVVKSTTNSKLTGSFKGESFTVINSIPVSFDGTSTFSVSSSYSEYAKFAKTITAIDTFGEYISSSLGPIKYEDGPRNGTYLPNNNTQIISFIDSLDWKNSPNIGYKVATFNVPDGKKLKWFKICGTIVSGTGTTANTFRLNGVSLTKGANTLPFINIDDAVCSLGWQRSNITSVPGGWGFTVEGKPKTGHNYGTELCLRLHIAKTNNSYIELVTYTYGYV